MKEFLKQIRGNKQMALYSHELIVSTQSKLGQNKSNNHKSMSSLNNGPQHTKTNLKEFMDRMDELSGIKVVTLEQ